MNNRCIIGLIDNELSPNSDYKYILCVYQDHLIKFCILRPLTSNNVRQVAEVLLDIFCLFGASVVVQSNKHKNFRK